MPGGSFRSHSSFQTRDLSRRELQHPWPFCSLTMSQTFHTEQFYYRMLTWWPTEEKLNHCSSSSPRVWTKRRPNIHFLSFSRFYSLIAAPLHKTQIMCKRGVTEEKEELKLSSRGDFGVKVLLQRRSRSYRCSVCLWWLHDHHLRNAADNQELQELLSHSAAFSLSVEGWLKAQQLCWWQAVVTTSTEHQHSSTNKWEECVHKSIWVTSQSWFEGASFSNSNISRLSCPSRPREAGGCLGLHQTRPLDSPEDH